MGLSGIRLTITIFITLAFLLPSCGGMEEERTVSPPTGEISQPTVPTGMSTVLEWDPPVATTDGAPMDPKRDLDYYELYLRTDRNFGDADLPVALISSFTDIPSPNGGSFKRFLTNDFSMDNLLPFIENGKQYYVSIRAIGVDGQKSEFMNPVFWDQTI